ncbi:MAG: hypothetical protein ACLKAK_12060 [Alkaliphilus sp.]
MTNNGSNEYKILTVLPYKISEELFKEKIGSGDDLKNLIDMEALKKYHDGYMLNDHNSMIGDIIKAVDDELKTKLHNDMSENFYKPRIKQREIIDYTDFVQKYNDYINLSYHLRELKKYDESMNTLFDIAKKLVYWGERDLLVEELKKFDSSKINDENKLWKIYYKLFAEIIGPHNRSLDLDYVNRQFKHFESCKEINAFLYIESKNLEGIFARVYEKNLEKATDIHLRLKRICIDELNLIDDRDAALYGKILQNIAFCYMDRSLDESIGFMEQAKKILKQTNDRYEVSKLHFYKLLLHYRKDPECREIIEYLKIMKECINEFTFPDIERNFYNLIAEMGFDTNKNFRDYFETKLFALDCDLALYTECFQVDLFSILFKIKENWNELRDDIIEGLDILIEFMDSTFLKDECLFFEALLNYAKGEKYIFIIDKMESEGLKAIFNDFAKDLSY